MSNKTFKKVFEGVVKTGADHTYIIADDDTGDTFNIWLHKYADKLEGKKVKITVEEIGRR